MKTKKSAAKKAQKKPFISRKEGAKIRKQRQATSKAVAVVAKEKPTGVVVKSESHGLLSLANPGQIFEFGKVLQNYIKDNNLSVDIEGKSFPLAGAWKFTAANFGLNALPGELKQRHKEGQYIHVLYVKKPFKGERRDGSKYEYTKDVCVFSGFANATELIDRIKAQNNISKEIIKPYYSYDCTVEVERMSDGRIVSRGTTNCNNLEALRFGSDEYSIMGMAQTRAISRALKNKLDFVLHTAGLESTPGEEMDEKIREAAERKAQSEYVDTEPVDQEPVIVHAKPLCSKHHFNQILDRIQKGLLSDPFQKYADTMSFSDQQREAIEIALKAVKS